MTAFRSIDRHRSRQAAFLCACIALAGSAAEAARAPAWLPPPTLPAEAVVQVIPLTAEQASPHHMQRPLDAGNTIVYDQQFGNSVGAGVLLGPLGVAANIANTKRRTESETKALAGKLDVDGLALAQEALASAGYAVAATEGTPAVAIVTPSIRIVSSGDEALHVSAVLTVHEQRADGTPWTGTYTSYLGTDLQRAEVLAGLTDERREALAAEVRDAFVQAAALLRDDAAGSLANGRQFFFRSKTLSPRFNFQAPAVELPSTVDGRLLMRTPTSVVSVPTDRVEIVKYVEPRG